MPSQREHLRASKRLLGTANPLVHRIFDMPSPKREHRHRHHPETARLIGELLGFEAKREAWLHLFIDWGIIEEKDWRKPPVCRRVR